MADLRSQHERLRVALRANGLSTDGSLQECLNRFMSAGTARKDAKRKRDVSKSPTQPLLDTYRDMIAHNLSSVSTQTLRSLALELQTQPPFPFGHSGHKPPKLDPAMKAAVVDGIVDKLLDV